MMIILSISYNKGPYLGPFFYAYCRVLINPDLNCRDFWGILPPSRQYKAPV
jgi:hypothetical protein